MTNQAIMMGAYGEEIFFPVFAIWRDRHRAFGFPNFDKLKQVGLLLRNFFKPAVFESIDGDEDVKDMLEFQKGDKKAFLRIYNRNKRKVYSWAYRMLGNESTAEEISQEVFIRVMRSQRTYKPLAKFTTLLYTITSRLVFNESRRKSRHPEDEIEPEQWQNMPDVSSEWMKSMEQQEKREILERAIRKVPERQRAVLMLRYIDGMSHEEIGQIMELKTQAVKSLLNRGLSSLMVVLKQEGVVIQ